MDLTRRRFVQLGLAAGGAIALKASSEFLPTRATRNSAEGVSR